MLEYIELESSAREEFIDISPKISALVGKSGVKRGRCTVFVAHTTAAVTINEGADPAVTRDMLVFFRKMVPEKGDYRHAEGNSDAHIKTSLIGSSETILIDGGELLLGTWQSVYFCEFDGPRRRRVAVYVD